ncbi:hypothetical protein [Alteromonas halophila]|uniref:Uncharacterized protein n=1 Tax=Alteromonas halophila TaxID=516698 RepID=A0A918JDE9_9ALTE|nr:hypothetical protein [Alteromonas halophila]GGW75094.1 hypothetical protein GCM10007391_04110 [Alteromonas halophila]
MTSEATLLVGRVLQIRDKLMAKRHCIPSSLLSEWNALTAKTACFDAGSLFDHAAKGSASNKPTTFSGTVGELQSMVSQLDNLNTQVQQSQARH